MGKAEEGGAGRCVLVVVGGVVLGVEEYRGAGDVVAVRWAEPATEHLVRVAEAGDVAPRSGLRVRAKKLR